jgi:hypothetical protein
MSRVGIAGGLLAAGLLVCLSGPAQAQAPFWSPLPYLGGRSLRPYLHPFGPYGRSLGYSLPYMRSQQRELRQAIGRQTAVLQLQEAGVQQLRRRVSEIHSQAVPRAPIRPTGAGSTFMNHSHYYSGMGSRGGAAPRRGTTRPTRSGSFSARSYSGAYSGR